MFRTVSDTRLVEVDTGRCVTDDKKSKKFERNDTVVRDYMADESHRQHNESKVRHVCLNMKAQYLS